MTFQFGHEGVVPVDRITGEVEVVLVLEAEEVVVLEAEITDSRLLEPKNLDTKSAPAGSLISQNVPTAGQ